MMEALYGRTGQVHAWLDTDSGNILDLRGQHTAFVDGNSVYDWTGRHIGWWSTGVFATRTMPPPILPGTQAALVSLNRSKL